jgi:hemerythrin superfamily protein
MTGAAEPDVVDQLLAQHSEIEELFAEVLVALGERKRNLFQELVRVLAVHETVEEELIHPRVRVEAAAAEPVVDGRLREEQGAKRELAELYELGTEHPHFDRRLTSLARAVLEHAAREEQEEFPYLRSALAPAERRRLASAMRAAQALAPTRPHPAVPPSAVANLVAGAPLAVFDRIRDLIRDARTPS